MPIRAQAPSPSDPKATTRTQAADMEVEIPRAAFAKAQAMDEVRTVLKTSHAVQAIIKAQQPQLNRKQRRQIAHRMQARATKARM